MNEIRITLISDAVSEFPDNTNTNFKVRLQEPIRLHPEQQWQAAMVSLSTPNRPVTLMKNLGLKDQDTLFVYGVRVLNEKFGVSDAKHIDEGAHETVSVGGVFGGVNPDNLTGVEFWSRIALTCKHYQTWEMIRNARRNAHWNKVFDEESTIVDVDPLAQTARVRGTDNSLSPATFGLNLTVAKYFELVRETSPGVYNLGRNAFYEGVNTYEGGRAQHRVKWPIESDMMTFDNAMVVKKWQPTGEEMVYFSRHFNWWFNELNTAADNTSASSADDKTTSTRLALVYCDLVQSSLVGNQKHQLLRELTLKDSGGSRRSVEPLHYQWLPLRNNVIDVVHVQLSDADGKFLAMPRGKTMLTVTLKRA